MSDIYKFKCSPIKQHYPQNKEESDNGWYLFSVITSTDLPHCSRYNKVYSDILNNEPTTQCYIAFVAGNMPQLEKGIQYEMEAELEKNKSNSKWGYKCINCTPIIPDTEEGREDFLRTIVTEIQADNILKAYPDFIDDVKNNKPITHEEIFGIGEKALDKIKRKVVTTYSLSSLYRLLIPFKITERKIQQLLKGSKNPMDLERRIRKDPYMLTDIKGIGFMAVDDIALKLYPNTRISEGRVKAFLKELLGEIAFSDGNTLVNEDVLLNGLKYGKTYKYKGLMKVMPECREIYNKLMEEQRND